MAENVQKTVDRSVSVSRGLLGDVAKIPIAMEIFVSMVARASF